ncbi:MAG: hypothetical protein JXB17_00195 [Bacteroidales bacterium]|nr:hypothetical protein [Bacteroidales bacterium]
MKRLFFILGIITIISLNMILIMGGGVKDFEKIEEIFNIILLIFEISIVPTCIYYFIKNLVKKNKIFALLFSLIIASYIFAYTLYFMKIEIPRILLYIFDVYTVNLYLIFYVKFWKQLISNEF